MLRWTYRCVVCALAGLFSMFSFSLAQVTWASTITNPTIYAGEVIDVTVTWNYGLKPDPSKLANQGYVSFQENDIQLGTMVPGDVVSTNGNQTTYQVTVPNLNPFNPSSLDIVVNSMAPYYDLGNAPQHYTYSMVPIGQLPEVPFSGVFPLLVITGSAGIIVYLRKKKSVTASY